MDKVRRHILKTAICASCQFALFPVTAVFSEESFSTSDPHTREAFFYKVINNKTVMCGTCPHKCIIIPDNLGRCRTRVNLEGKLYTISYGNPCAVNVDPVEKKPLLHFYPGTRAFSLAVAGCNFTCLNCQNWEISQTSPDKTRNYDMSPEDVVVNARKYNCKSIAYTYSEPVTFYEYMYDTSKIAHEQGIKNIWVSNAYLNPKAVEKLCGVIDGASLNLKSFSDEIYSELNGGHLKPVLETFRVLKENDVWMELINLVIPTFTDKMEMIKQMCGWILDNLGPDVPLHFSRFYPKYRLMHLPPTPVNTLLEIEKAVKSLGLNHVYIGNVPGMGEETYCSKCGEVLIKRGGYNIIRNKIVNGKCSMCGEAVPGRWE